jgi:hypothetical protein
MSRPVIRFSSTRGRLMPRRRAKAGRMTSIRHVGGPKVFGLIFLPPVFIIRCTADSVLCCRICGVVRSREEL